MLDFNSVMIGSEKPQVLADFYEKVFDREADWSDEGWWGWQVGSSHLTIGEHSEVKGKAAEPQRVILNLETETVKEEFERMKELGATVIKEPYEMGGMSVATLADPDGNYFQLMSPWNTDTSVN
jgi:predicted enzyme related to lactoylglutathione lyase